MRWFQFRLRSIFVATTLAAVLSVVGPPLWRRLMRPERAFPPPDMSDYETYYNSDGKPVCLVEKKLMANTNRPKLIAQDSAAR